MVLCVLGVAFVFLILREMVRLWHEPDAVHWVGPFEMEPEDLELEPELHSDGQQGAGGGADQQQQHGKDDGHGHGKETPAADAKSQRPRCPYWNKNNCTFEKPLPNVISCCGPLPSEQAKPKVNETDKDVEIMKLLDMMPPELRRIIYDEASKIDAMNRPPTPNERVKEEIKPVDPEEEKKNQ